ncbi:MAG: M20/M25/M40 family metallo-hydrolase [Candidatus Latescibacteria bacterium]|nr:M20/M25/M40 family metallo-hydrolase [Candidatus Latescibacterota bacterium]NIM21965.1 M20/M25/M40 family metallo-hydrolase [Candidatus Latescibacterota bacterium]NIM65983.1 M20/M25/M40 family metallo-hydrolase [Candidatus Latescibacterota bacterium]NIO02391.1 M20/M25/M40 family metallo-hydrolase [Candidatus Latescibacterota bacterium]NIO29301.1 M20/M25/M40 family metallo-hydrolase [Candidatus Latescibacterota bacterium]
MTKRERIVALFFCLFSAFSASITHGVDVSEQALMAHVHFLTSDHLEGRRAARAGDLVTEEYVRSIFVQAGLKPLPGLGDYRQEIVAIEATMDRQGTSLGVVRDEEVPYFRVDREVFCLLNGRSDLNIRAPLVFAGFGITAPEYEYDDYAGIDVEGKVVLVLNNEPGDTSDGDKFRGRAPTRYSFPKMKEEIARRHGAVGMIIVNNAASGHPDLDVSVPKRYGRELREPYFGLEVDEERIPIFFATKPVVDAMLGGTNVDIIERQERIDKRMKPVSASVQGREVILNVQIASVERKEIANIIGYLEGGDAALKHEFIVIGAHHDHLGVGEDGAIFYGADDNASGTAGLLESARILAGEAGRLKRSILFVSFCAEERGLLGSKYFIMQPPISEESLCVMINMDMIGRNNMDKTENENMFIVFTSAQTPALERAVRSEAKALDLDVRVAPYVRFRGASDHSLFHNRGIPVVFYFSGFHKDYNRSTDTIDKIVPNKIVKVVSHLCRFAEALSEDRGIDLKFDRAITVEPEKDPFENPYSVRASRQEEDRSQNRR